MTNSDRGPLPSFLMDMDGVLVHEEQAIPGADRFFIWDPDKNRIEIIQWLEPYDPAVSGASRLDGMEAP